MGQAGPVQARSPPDSEDGCSLANFSYASAASTKRPWPNLMSEMRRSESRLTLENGYFAFTYSKNRIASAQFLSFSSAIPRS